MDKKSQQTQLTGTPASQTVKEIKDWAGKSSNLPIAEFQRQLPQITQKIDQLNTAVQQLESNQSKQMQQAQQVVSGQGTDDKCIMCGKVKKLIQELYKLVADKSDKTKKDAVADVRGLRQISIRAETKDIGTEELEGRIDALPGRVDNSKPGRAYDVIYDVPNSDISVWWDIALVEEIEPNLPKHEQPENKNQVQTIIEVSRGDKSFYEESKLHDTFAEAIKEIERLWKDEMPVVLSAATNPHTKESPFGGPDASWYKEELHNNDGATAKKDKLKGGVGDDIPYEKLNEKQLEMGTKVEMEHTNNKEVAKEIAGDHLAEELKDGKEKEDQEYYTKLKKVHEDKCSDAPSFWRRNLDYGSH